MKKLLLLLVPVLLSACMTAKPLPPPATDISIDDKYADGKIVIAGIGFSYEDGIFGGSRKYKGVLLTVENATDDVVTVKWSASTIGFDGLSHSVFLTGQKYIDAGRPMPDQVIAPKSKIETGVYPADNVHYVSGRYGGWEMRGIIDRTVALTLCVETGTEKRFYTIMFKRSE